MRVLLLTDSDAFAGTEQHMLALSVGLTREGHAVYVGSPGGSLLAERCAASRIETIAIEKIGIVDLIAVAKCVYHIHRNSIDVLHVHNSRTALIASIVKLFVREIRVVFTQHFIAPMHASRHGMLRILSDGVHRFIAGGLDQIICVSESTKTALLKRGGAYSGCKSTVVYNGIDVTGWKPTPTDVINDLKSELNIPPDASIVFIASRLEPEKAVGIGITALVDLLANGMKLVLLVAGNGSQINDLQQLAKKLGIENSVRLLGFRSDIPVLMAAADVFLFTSPVDSFGMSLLEAMVCGTPVVAANAGGPAEIVLDGKTGFLFNKDDIADLRQKVIDCLSCPTLEQVSKAARNSVEINFSVESMALKTIENNETLLSRAR